MKQRKKSLAGWLFLVLLTCLMVTGCANLKGLGLDELFSNSGQAETEEKGSREPEVKAARRTEREESKVIEKEETESEIQESLNEISRGSYVYGTLSGNERKVYNEVLTTILEHREKTEVSTLKLDVLDKVYKAVSADYGGLFWVSGYVYTQYTKGGEMVGLEFAPKYTMTNDERRGIQAQIDAEVDRMLSGISVSDTDYEKVKYVFETLIREVDYDAASENNQNIISVFLNHSTVCQGYACATQYLLKILGIESVIVTGNANGESHAWNLVKLDGAYYHMDTTWGNSRYLDDSSQTAKYINYSYLAVTSEEIGRTHTADTVFTLPECVAVANNYFVREGKYFDSFDAERIGGVLKEAWDTSATGVAVKFASRELYEEALSYFITQQHIADYCTQLTSIYYLEDPQQYILTVNFIKN